MSKKYLPNFKEMSTEKLAFVGLLLVVLLFATLIILGIYAPTFLATAGAVLMIVIILAIAYGFCYAIVNEFRNGSDW